ncbi:MAG: hypothetical protein N3A72_06570 [bacterium]|nr:hypothetical protein [bacterium]
MKPSLFIGILFLCLLLSSTLLADTLVMKDGTRLSCVIIAEDAKHLVIETQFGSMSITKKSIAQVGRDTPDKNLILRGDFYVMRNDVQKGLEYYAEALTLYPNSKEAKEKYRIAREKLEKTEQQQIAQLNQSEEKLGLDITPENKEAAKAQLKLTKKEQLATLILYGFGAYPANGSTREKTKSALVEAKLDALKKAFGDAVGIGFSVSKGKVKIYPPGELPHYKIKVLAQQKVEQLGYAIKLQVQAPSSSLLFSIPDNLPIFDGFANVAIDKQSDYKAHALHEAYRQVVLKAIAIAPQLGNKPTVTGRIFLVNPPSEYMVTGFYQVSIQAKVWLDSSTIIQSD